MTEGRDPMKPNQKREHIENKVDKQVGESGGQPDLLDAMKEVEQFISDLASSAMLAGEEYPAEDRSTFYSEACKAKNSIAWIMDEYAREVAKHAPLSQSDSNSRLQARITYLESALNAEQILHDSCHEKLATLEAKHAPLAQQDILGKIREARQLLREYMNKHLSVDHRKLAGSALVILEDLEVELREHAPLQPGIDWAERIVNELRRLPDERQITNMIQEYDAMEAGTPRIAEEVKDK